jgi:hypothetical protein
MLTFVSYAESTCSDYQSEVRIYWYLHNASFLQFLHAKFGRSAIINAIAFLKRPIALYAICKIYFGAEFQRS